MALTLKVRRDFGHPWDGRPGFDLMELFADTETERDAAVAAARRKFWEPWLVGHYEATGQASAVLYKPCDIRDAWDDGYRRPHPGRPRKGSNGG